MPPVAVDPNNKHSLHSVSRPGQAYHSDGPNTQTTLHGIEFMSHGVTGPAPPTPAASVTDDFGDFAQGPSFTAQGDDFSDFQEAQPVGQGTPGTVHGSAHGLLYRLTC